MTNQEILFRLFICEFMGWGAIKDEDRLRVFDIEEFKANRIIDLFPRENESESFEGFLDTYINLKSSINSFDSNIIRFNNKVKITILED